MNRRDQKPAEGALAAERSLGLVDASDPGSLLILLVDDDRQLSEIVCGQLEREGHCVVSAANGAEALSVLQAVRAPDLIILDLEMPVMDGWGLLAALRRSLALDDCPVIVTSSATPTFVARRRAELGRATFLRKPVDLEVLLGAIARCCGTAVAQRVTRTAS